jgi:PTH1 family peptidyl-tRNA hydrolase
MKLVFGLGNPGAEYKLTRHNAGFWAVDTYLARRKKKASQKAANAHYARLGLNGDEIYFVKPQSYMNRSGDVVAPWVREVGAEPDEVLIVHDEADLDPGRIQLKLGGGSGGHNGLASVFERWAERDFYRLRIGVGKDPGMELADYVLLPTGEALMRGFGEHGADALELILRDGPMLAVNEINAKAFQRVEA